jgi:hypothetical protein
MNAPHGPNPAGSTSAAVARPPALTADVNALAWGQFHLRGGWPRLWGFVGFYLAIAGALILIQAMTAGALAGTLKFGLTGLQAAILVLFVGGRISNAIRQDLTTRMIESHRLMPLSPAQAVVGYLVGPATHPLALAGANVLLGLVVCAAGGIPASLWLTANAVLLEFGAFLAVAMAFGAFSGKGSSAVVWVGFLIGVYSHAVIGFILPGLNVLATPLAGHSVFNLGATGGDAVSLYAPAAVFHLWFGAIFFAGACRRYTRDDRLALGADLGLILLAAWVCLSAFAIVRWEDYRSALIPVGPARRDVQFIGSMAAAMLLGIVPLNGAAFAAADWGARRALNDPSLGRRPVPPLVVALAAAGVAMLLVNVAVPTGSHVLRPGDPYPARTFIIPRTAVVLVSFFVTTLYALRLLYRRTGSPQISLLALLLFLTWLVPMGIDTAGWYLADDRQEVLRAASGFSPLGALIEVWTGSPGATTPGLLFQACLAAAMAALFHLTGPRPLPPSPDSKPGTETASSPAA